MLIFLYILIGLVGLGILVFIHELGHFIAARALGVQVEVFSVGWGKALISYRVKETEYRLAVFPLGGYCKMKGENYILSALDNPKEAPVPEPGSFYAAAPWRRIVIAVAGPAFNLIFAFLTLASIAWIAPPYLSQTNRIVLMTDFHQYLPQSANLPTETPASLAGLRTGDRILSIQNRRTESYEDIQDAITLHGSGPLTLEVQNELGIRTLVLTPIEKDGQRIIGIWPWIEPRIKAVKEKGPAANAGLLAGDTIVKIGGQAVRHHFEIFAALKSRASGFETEVLREGQIHKTLIVPEYLENEPDIGISYLKSRFDPDSPVLTDALVLGFVKTGKLLSQMVSGIAGLFTSWAFAESISGPIRITYIVGEVASDNFLEGFGEGMGAVMRFLSLLSVALFVMNLLPIPALDGGLIIINLIESVLRRRIKPIVVIRYQQIGATLILILVVFATINDVSFLFRQ